ncbi:MAG: DUF3341 domain-containing protein [Deltaproteobacteria bacterium]|nr:DUF3341 domain-containing protein [Deltaproteobacteria bacterium]
MSTQVIGYFDSEEGLLHATRDARRAGLTIVDAFTPYAVHGLDDAMGLRRSRLPWVCFLAGITGGTFAMSFQIWSSASSWALNVGGKPFASLPAFVPVTFEVTVLSAALASAFAFFARSRLFPGKTAAVLQRVTDDRFALVLGSEDNRAAAFLKHAGALEVQVP